MKLSNRYRAHRCPELSMTSMIDVVFLLLIFFLVTTTFVRPERQLQPSIKVEEKSPDQASSDLEPAIVDIVRQERGVMFKLGAIRTNDLDEIAEALRGFENKSDGAFVRVSGDVPFESAAQLIGVCRAVGFPSVSYIPVDN